MDEEKRYVIRVPFPDDDQYVFVMHKESTLNHGKVLEFNKYDDAYNYARDIFKNFDIITL